MHNIVTPVLKRLKTALSRFRTVPDLCHISFSTFVIELAKLDDRIAELVAKSSQRGELLPEKEKEIRRTELQFDLGLSEVECKKLLEAIQSHFGVKISRNDHRLIKRRRYKLVYMHGRLRNRAKMLSDPKFQSKPLHAAA